MIAAVNPGSPAEQAGLQSGQVIVGIDGKRIESDDDLIAAIKSRLPGQSIELAYRDSAGGEVRTTTVRLAQAGASPGPAAAGAAAPRPGIGSALVQGGNPPTDRITPGSRLLDRVERIADNLSPRPLSTVYDPQAFASLQDRVNQLENRLKAIEGRLGGSPPTQGGNSGSSGQATPGFGTPPQSTPPGFGPAGGTQ
jgi:membrane-associated protease RseP (regulator of RpoE activity)